MVAFPGITSGVVQQCFDQRIYAHKQTFPLLTALADALAEVPDGAALAARPKKALRG